MFGGNGRGERRLWTRQKLLMLVVVVFVFGVLLIGVNIYQLQIMHASHLAIHGGAIVEGSLDRWDMGRRPKVWVAGKRVSCIHVLLLYASKRRAKINYNRLLYLNGLNISISIFSALNQ